MKTILVEGTMRVPNTVENLRPLIEKRFSKSGMSRQHNECHEAAIQEAFIESISRIVDFLGVKASNHMWEALGAYLHDKGVDVLAGGPAGAEPFLIDSNRPSLLRIVFGIHVSEAEDVEKIKKMAMDWLQGNSSEQFNLRASSEYLYESFKSVGIEDDIFTWTSINDIDVSRDNPILTIFRILPGLDELDSPTPLEVELDDLVWQLERTNCRDGFCVVRSCTRMTRLEWLLLFNGRECVVLDGTNLPSGIDINDTINRLLDSGITKFTTLKKKAVRKGFKVVHDET